MTFVAFVVAAAIGSAGRALALHHLNPRYRLPVGTLAVNVTGTFLLGAVASWAPPWLTIVGVGALGAYTTFSTFAGDALRITQERGARLATGYVVLTVALCLLAAWLGLLVG